VGKLRVGNIMWGNVVFENLRKRHLGNRRLGNRCCTVHLHMYKNFALVYIQGELSIFSMSHFVNKSNFSQTQLMTLSIG
jgi:hypothetical protein